MKKDFLKNISYLIFQLAGLWIFLTNQVYADEITAPIDTTDINLNGIVNTTFQIVFGGGILICVIFLAMRGIQYVTAGDDAKKIEGARQGVTYAIIGLVVILLTFSIVKFIAIILVGTTTTELWDILPTSLSLTT